MDDTPERALAALETYGGWYGVLRALQDAERYRWVRSATTPGYLHFPNGEMPDGLALDALDAAIDAAMNGANA